MSSQRALIALEKLELMASVQGARAAADPFFLSASLVTALFTRKGILVATLGAASLAEGDRAGASLVSRACLEALQNAHRTGKAYLDGLLPEFVPVAVAGDPPHISDAVRLQQQIRYGFESGELGRFDDARTEELARLAPIAATTGVANAAWHYPQVLLDFIAGQLSTLQAHQPIATGGSRAAAVAAVLAATEAAEDIIARIRGFYISASDDGDRTPELKRIGLQPRRLPGEASDGIVPGTPGTATLNAAARTLTITTLPERANSIHVYRQKVATPTTPAGEPELAGVSLSTTVSFTQIGPMDAGVTYEVWVVGYDGTDEGPEGNHLVVTG